MAASIRVVKATGASRKRGRWCVKVGKRTWSCHRKKSTANAAAATRRRKRKKRGRR